MDKHDSQFYWIRTPSRAHRSSLYERGLKQAAQYVELVNAVFSHQPAATHDIEESNDYKAAGPNQTAAYFYKYCYKEPHVVIGNDGNRITLSELVELAACKSTDANRNIISYLLGNVGVGKTSLVNALLTLHAEELTNKYNRWFVRIDLEKAGVDRNYSTPKLLNAIAAKTLRVLRNNPDIAADEKEVLNLIQLVGVNTVPPDSFNEMDSTECQNKHQALLECYPNLVRAIRRLKGKHLFLVIDNLDVICHLNDRKFFREDNENGNYIKLRGLCDLARLFFHDTSELGRLGANILIVMREDSYFVLTRTGQTSLPEFDQIRITAYSVRAPSWQNVLESRGKLLAHFSKHIEPAGTRKRYEELTANMLDQLNTLGTDSLPLIKHIEALTNYGLRETMTFFGQLAILSEADAGSASRLLNRTPVGLIAYLLGGMRRYSQFLSRFPNAYLVNKQPAEEFTRNHEHPHSYWLKRLILAFLHERTKNGEMTSYIDIENIFCRSQGKAYDVNIVKECLGGMAEVNYSNLLQITREVFSSSVEVTNIRLSSRGIHFLTSVVDRFFYLQLIVEDFMLPIPRLKDKVSRVNLMQDFQSTETDPDYAYLMHPSGEYREGANKMILRKSHEVMVFIEILEASLAAEEALYPGVFQALKNSDIPLPVVSEIRKGVMYEIKLVAGECWQSYDEKTLQEYCNMHREPIRQFLKKSYEMADRTRLEGNATTQA